MNGYLARLAKQSGIKYPASALQARAWPAGGRVEVPVAPESERTVFVDADAPRAQLSWAPESRRMQGTPPHPGPERAMDIAKIRESGTKADAPRVVTRGEPNYPAAAAHAAAPAREQLEDGAHSELRDAPARDLAADDPRLVDLTRPVQATPSGAAYAEAAQPDVSRPAKLEAEYAARPAPFAEPKLNFTRTAEILGNEAAPAVELQAVIFREVQEWVAAAPDAPRLEADRPTSALRLLAPAQARAPEAAAALAEPPRDAPDRAQPVEQRFDLSIGTINVTIEEPETPRRPDPQPRQPDPAARDDRSRTSRLGRSYL